MCGSIIFAFDVIFRFTQSSTEKEKKKEVDRYTYRIEEISKKADDARIANRIASANVKIVGA